VTIGQSPVDTVDYVYDAANRLTQADGQSITYDNAGRMTDDSNLIYTWDKADRLLSTNDGQTTTSYAYDGLGNRVRQSVGATVTDYLLDVQPGLVKVLASTTGATTTRFLHGPRGIFAHEASSGAWG
jgi:YD repeat-containing protein